jgi:hypothetical protein
MFFVIEYSRDIVPFGGVVPMSVRYFMVRNAPTDLRWVEGVGVGGKQPGSNAEIGRSLDVAQRS